MNKKLLILLCVAFIATGIGFIRITQHQEQKNDQSQRTIVNTITKTVIVNVPREKKYKNIKWKIVSYNTLKQMSTIFYEDMNQWQRMSSKFVPAAGGTGCILYPTINETPIVYTNGTSYTNNSKSYNTNVSKVETIFTKIKSVFF